MAWEYIVNVAEWAAFKTIKEFSLMLYVLLREKNKNH